MLNAGTRSSRVALPVWLAIASLVPAQNAPEKLPEPEKTPEDVAAPEKPKLPEPEPAPEKDANAPELQKTGAATPDKPKLPEPTPGTTSPTLPKPEMATKPGDGTPALPVPEAPPEGTIVPIPVAPGTPTEGNPLIPGSLPGDPNAVPGSPLLPGADSSLLAPGEFPIGEDPFATEGDSLIGGQPSDGLFGDPLQTELPSAETAPASPFGADQGDFGFEEEEREGFTFVIEGSANYSSNLELREDNEESTFYTILSPGFEYRSALSGRAINTITAEYLADFNLYFDDDIDDTIDHNLKANYTHRGSRGLVEFETRYLRTTDSNRFTNSLTETTDFTTSLDFTYRLSAKTNLYASAEYSTRSNDVSSEGDSDLFTASFSALWDFSAKTDFGPALRYANNKAGSTGDSESTALEVEARYSHSKKLNFVLNAGIEAATYNDEDTEYSPSGSIKATYKPSRIWQFTGDLRYQAIPVSQLNSETFGGDFYGGGFSDLNGAAAGGGQQLNGSLGVVYQPDKFWRISSTLSHRTAPSFINANESLVDTTINFRVMRQIGEASLSALYSFSTTEFESNDGGDREDQNYHMFGLDYVHPEIFKKMNFRAGLGYSLSSGESDYDEFRITTAFGYRF